MVAFVLFFVAHVSPNKRPTFDWREAPMRKYESFADFYQRELERTFGTWENLQHTWNEVVKGKLTETQARERIKLGHGGDRRSERAKVVQADNVSLKHGNSRDYLISRLEDGEHVGLVARVRAGTMSARAAAIEAGIITPSTPLDQLRKAWAKASEDERQFFLDEVMHKS